MCRTLFSLAVDKSEGCVKDKSVLSGVCDTACSPEKVEDQAPGISRFNHHSEERIAPPTIDTALNCDHDSSMRTSSRRVCAEVGNAFSRFPRRVSAVFCMDQSGCESAHSVFRSSFRRPRPTSSCSRYERSPDTGCLCAASRTVVLLICVRPPPWPHLSPCGGSGVSTACEILHLDE